ncbi:MAG TPA: anti-sigma factor [Thermoanaerobaculaceae bacterium]|nr:anti-sigma factor [Thermoanaerobaculaceae bacterium]
MTCAELRAVLATYLDGELDAPASAEVERHLAGCAACAALVAAERSLRAAFRDPALRYAAPPELAGAIGPALRSRAGAGERRPLAWTRLAMAAALLIAAAIGSLATRLALAPSADRVLAADVLSSHLRSLAGDHLADVASSDQHTVKPWFAGRLDFSPTVTDLAAEGFPLAGGRLDVLAGHPVAALVYRRRLHVINLYTWPAPSGGGRAPEAESIRGYNLVRWAHGGMEFWAVSDLERQELAHFAGLLIGHR